MFYTKNWMILYKIWRTTRHRKEEDTVMNYDAKSAELEQRDKKRLCQASVAVEKLEKSIKGGDRSV